VCGIVLERNLSGEYVRGDRAVIDSGGTAPGQEGVSLRAGRWWDGASLVGQLLLWTRMYAAYARRNGRGMWRTFATIQSVAQRFRLPREAMVPADGRAFTVVLHDLRLPGVLSEASAESERSPARNRPEAAPPPRDHRTGPSGGALSWRGRPLLTVTTRRLGSACALRAEPL